MRAVALVVGGLLVIGGAVLVVSADHQRADALAEAKAAVAETRRQLDAAKDSNHRLAEQLTTLRSLIAEQDRRLADTTGLLQ